jgi:protein SCO1
MANSTIRKKSVGRGAGRSASAAAKPPRRAANAPGLGVRPLIGGAIGAALLFAVFVAVTNKAAAPPVIGGPFELTTQTGRAYSDRDLIGQPHLVFFGFTNCQDICHTTLFEMSEVMRALGPDAPIAGLFVTVDPERDTPEILKDYLSSFDTRIVGLTGTRSALDPMLEEYKIYAKRSPGQNGDYSIDHGVIVYLMDKNGKFVSTFDVSRNPADAARDLKRYL